MRPRPAWSCAPTARSRWSCGVSLDWLMTLGHFPDQHPDEPFNMAVLCSELSGHITAVPGLHGEVTEQRVRGGLWPRRGARVATITNGVPPPTWTPPPMAALFDEHVGDGWEYAGPDRWEGVWDIPDGELWRGRRGLRARTGGDGRGYLPGALRAGGGGGEPDAGPRGGAPRGAGCAGRAGGGRHKE